MGEFSLTISGGLLFYCVIIFAIGQGILAWYLFIHLIIPLLAYIESSFTINDHSFVFHRLGTHAITWKRMIRNVSGEIVDIENPPEYISKRMKITKIGFLYYRKFIPRNDTN